MRAKKAAHFNDGPEVLRRVAIPLAIKRSLSGVVTQMLLAKGDVR